MRIKVGHIKMDGMSALMRSKLLSLRVRNCVTVSVTAYSSGCGKLIHTGNLKWISKPVH